MRGRENPRPTGIAGGEFTLLAKDRRGTHSNPRPVRVYTGRRRPALGSRAGAPQVLTENPPLHGNAMASLVRSSLDQGVGRITLARPEKRNALSRELISELTQAVDQLAADPALRVLVLAAEGSVFCAGMDLGEMQQRAADPDGAAQWQKDSEVYAELLSKLFHLPVPTIAAMQGPALAGGVGMILACDLVVAAEGSFVMLPEPMRGITAAMVTPFLVFRVGGGPATQMLLCGRRISAQRCHELGLVYQLADGDDLDTTVQRVTTSVLSGSPAALAITKRHLHSCAAAQLDALLQASIGVSAEARQSDDAREGLDAFLEKRDPAWCPADVE